MNDIDIFEQQAVDAAINLNWEQAIELNKKIIELDKENIAAYLRLGFAYIHIAKTKEAKKAYHKVLRIQPKNPVALDNLEKIEVFEEKGGKKTARTKTVLDPSLFLETPGKTKTVGIVNIGQKNHLAELIVGQEVELKLKKRKVEVRTSTGSYIGTLPDDLSKRLIFFLKAKSIYKAYIKEAGLTKVVIFIQEEKKGKRVAHYTSFPNNIQTNLDQIAANEEAGENVAEYEDEDEWEKLANEIDSEEKEELPLIHSEDDETEE